MERSKSEEREPENKYNYTTFPVRLYYFVHTNKMDFCVFLSTKGELT